MKTKNGKVSLEKGEVRVNNFFFKAEKEHIKVQDINSLISFRIARMTAPGMWLKAMIDKGVEAENTLHIYAAAMFSVLLTVPDDEMVEAVLETSQSSVKRHPEWYGLKAEALSDEEDAKIVDGEKAKAEFVEQVKNLEGAE